jgi:hypothetical protein
MNSKDRIFVARERLDDLQAMAEKAIRSQNHHRIILIFLFSIAVALLIGFLMIEIFAGQANPILKSQDSAGTSGQEEPSSDEIQTAAPPPAGGVPQTATPSASVPETATASATSFPTATVTPTPDYRSLDRATPIPVGIVFQGTFLVSVISLLVVRRATLRAVDTADLSATAKKIERLEEALNVCSEHLKSHMQKSGLQEHTLEGFLQVLEKDKAAKKALAPAVVESIDRLRSSNDELAKIGMQIESASDEAKGMYLSGERIFVGHTLAIIALVVSAIPLWIWLTYHRAIAHQGAYLALATISCACVAAAHALLGRRKTDEARFIEDLRNLSTTVGVMETMFKPIQISGGEHKTVYEASKGEDQ